MITILPLIFLVAAFLFTLVGKISIANIFASLFLVSLIIICTYLFFQIISFDFAKKLFSKKIIQKFVCHYKIILGILIAILLIRSSISPMYYFGGDDTRLFFLYPNEYYSNFASKLVGDNSLSNIGNFLPATSISFFVIFVSILHFLLPFINLQAFLYTLNIILGIYFFYLLLKYILHDTLYSSVISFISSFLYVYSIFNFYTLYNSRLIAVFLISVFPLTVYLFLRAVNEKKLYYLAIIAIVLSVFSVISVSSIWYFASLLTCLPILLYVLLPRWKTMIGYLGILFFLCFLLNLHWLYYLPHTTLASKAASTTNSLVSEEFLTTNADGVRSTSEINSLFYPLLNTYHRQIQLNFNWPFKSIYESWYLNFLPLNVIFIGVIFIAGIMLDKKTKLFSFYIVGSASLLLSLYLFTVNVGIFTFGSVGIEFFIWLVNNVPGFVVFRNMYDKFGHGLSISFAILLAISLSMILPKLSAKGKNGILIVISVLALLNAKPFLLHEFDLVPIWTTSHLFQGSTDFNEDYKNLVSYVKNQEYRGRYVVLPMSGGNVIPIQNKSLTNHFYVGVSPMLILSGKNDYSGLLSFGPYERRLKEAVYKKDNEEIGRIFQLTNTKYIIVNHAVPAELQNSYMYPEGLYTIQDDEFIQPYLGEKLADFGKSYSLYEINKRYDSEKVIATTTLDSVVSEIPVTYKKISSNEYILSVNELLGSTYIQFFEQNDLGWSLRTSDNRKSIGEEISTTGPYKNIWKIDSEDIKTNIDPSMYTLNDDGTLSITLRIFFEPYHYYQPLLIFSSTLYALLTIYVIFEIYKTRKNRKAV